VFRFDAPLIFANARTFREEIRALAAADPHPRWIVIAAEPITDVDTTASDMLEDLVPELDEAGIRLVFAELKGPVRDKLRQYEFSDILGDERFFPTLESALEAFGTADSHE
jgi:MFS superfamily sulfate permease-like transporter